MKYESPHRRGDFANRPEGRIRREIRLARIAAKRSWQG